MDILSKESRQGIEFIKTLAEWRGRKDFNTDNIIAVMNELGDPQDSFKAVQVAGTNGKGSVASGIAAILGASGAVVGALISPHLSVVNERIVVNGLSVSDALLGKAAVKVEKACRKLDVKLSFFEGIVATGFILFHELGVEWGVLETGLGGRLDATNIVKNTGISCITSISFDHQHILGETLSLIASEKAGIIKPEIPVVTGLLPGEARDVIVSSARRNNSRLMEYDADFRVENSTHEGREGIFFSDELGRIPFRIPLKGDYQRINSGVAIAAARVLGVSADDCVEGISTLFWPARIETGEIFGRELVLDCAHNIEGFKGLMKYIGDEPITLVCGFLTTKDWQGMLECAAPSAKEVLILEPDSPMAATGRDLCRYISGIGIRNTHCRSYDYLLEVLKNSPGREKIVIAGSIYLVGKLRRFLLESGLTTLTDRPFWIQRKEP